MKVRMRQALSGSELSLKPGQEHEGDPKEMARWCEMGIAVPVKSSSKRKATSSKAAKAEKAVPKPPKTPEVIDDEDS